MKIVRIAPGLLPDILSTGAKYTRTDGATVEITEGLPPGMSLDAAAIEPDGWLKLCFDVEPEEDINVAYSLTMPSEPES